jgi:hypothetical protein
VTIVCVRCGGIVALQVLSRRTHCPYCGHDQDVPPHRLAQLARDERSAGDLASRLHRAGLVSAHDCGRRGRRNGRRADGRGWRGDPGGARRILAARARQRRSLGFTPSSCAGGLVAVGGVVAVDCLRKADPVEAADLLATVARLLVEWAASVGAAAAGPAP